MHEYALCEGIHEAVLRHAQGRPVTRVGVRAGVLHHLTPESVNQAFEVVAANGPAAGASVELVTVPARGHCRSCGADSELSDYYATCPRCQSPDIEVAAGDELVLEWLEYSESEQA